MITKLFEIRDSAAFIPVLAVQLVPLDDAERYLLSRSGFGNDDKGYKRYVVVHKLAISKSNGTYDPYNWPGDTRTMCVAHNYIQQHFDQLESGDVIDVEFILGLTEEPKRSERYG